MSARGGPGDCAEERSSLDSVEAVIEEHLGSTLGLVAMEDRFRLAGLERFVGQVQLDVLMGLWQLIGSDLNTEAEKKARVCRCGRKRQTRSKPVEVRVRGITTVIPCTYFCCRHCHLGESPVRQWLGVENGDTSLELQRVLTDLTERMTFGDAARSLQEQQGQEIDRTQAERITYQVGQEAQDYLAARRGALWPAGRASDGGCRAAAGDRRWWRNPGRRA